MSRWRQRRGPLTCESYIRDMLPTLRDKLARHLDVYNSWEGLAAGIPENPEYILVGGYLQAEPLYDGYNIASLKSEDSPTKALLVDLGTKYQMRHLIKLLLDNQLIEAAKLLILACCQPVQQPCDDSNSNNNGDNGNGSIASCNHSQMLSMVEAQILSLNSGVPTNNGVQSQPPSIIPRVVEQLQRNSNVEDRLGVVTLTHQEHYLPDMSYLTLSRITGFDSDTSKKLGVGGFAEVFLGTYSSQNGYGSMNYKVAVKRLMSKDEQHMAMFHNEIQMLTQIKHDNVLKLLGYCCDGALPCLVFEFIFHGALEDMLFQNPLHMELTSVWLRLDIATGAARAIEFLHKKCVVHRDIKSANILLDENFCPKLCDFATSRSVPSMWHHTVQIIGTPSHMAPEAYDCVVQPSMDVFSFGIVLLELLTGLAANDATREFPGLREHVLNYCDEEEECSNSWSKNTIFDLIDKRPGVDWPNSLVAKWYKLADNCLLLNTG